MNKEKKDKAVFFQKCPNPVDKGLKLNLHKTWTSWTSSERLMYVQFTSCVYWEKMMSYQIKLHASNVREVYLFYYG